MRRVSVMVAFVVAINTMIAIVILRLSSSPALYVASLAVVTTVVVVGLFRPEGRKLVFNSAAVVELFLGMLGIFSVGLPLIVASVVLFVAADVDAGVPGVPAAGSS